MKSKFLLSSVLVVAFSAPALLFADEKAEFGSTFVDRDVCPFECCQYGDWTSTEPIVLRARPDESAEILARIDAGSVVQAITGEVHTLPGRFKVKKDSPRYRAGDVLLILTYRGEGTFRIQFNGRIYSEEFAFGPGDDGYSDDECTEVPSCIGVLEVRPESKWWALVRHSGTEGWVLVEDNFSGTDACG
jgi:hypothetical protein